MAKRDSLTHARLLELLVYNQTTGIFTWRITRKGRGCVAGREAGTTSRGYLIITIDYVRHRANRLAWFYVHGAWPEAEIDHRDTIRHHNWIDNLRPATSGENKQNLVGPKSNNKSGYLGVYPHSNGKGWCAQIKVDGTPIYLGIRDNPEDASALYWAAKATHHPFHGAPS